MLHTRVAVENKKYRIKEEIMKRKRKEKENQIADDLFAKYFDAKRKEVGLPPELDFGLSPEEVAFYREQAKKQEERERRMQELDDYMALLKVEIDAYEAERAERVEAARRYNGLG